MSPPKDDAARPAAVERDPGEAAEAGTADQGDQQQDERSRSRRRRKPDSAGLVELVLDRADVFVGDGEPYLTYRRWRGRDPHRVTWPLHSAEVRRWIARGAFRIFGAPPDKRAISDALDVLAGIAEHERGERQVHLRVAGDAGDAVYLDLGNWEAVEVDADGWRSTTDPPVHLVPGQGALPLPTPQRPARTAGATRALGSSSGSALELEGLAPKRSVKTGD